MVFGAILMGLGAVISTYFWGSGSPEIDPLGTGYVL